MIAKLTGKLDLRLNDSIIIDVNGVGYQVFASPSTLMNIGEIGEHVSVLIDTHVREDHIHLYGFRDSLEQQWFRLLTSVQGVGTRVGLAILGVCPPGTLISAIGAGDKAPLTQADGVGPKLAARIVTELKDKTGHIPAGVHSIEQPTAVDSQAGEGARSASASGEQSSRGLDEDAVSALVNLGYGRSDAFQAVCRVRQGANDANGLQDVIRLALKELSA